MRNSLVLAALSTIASFAAYAATTLPPPPPTSEFKEAEMQAVPLTAEQATEALRKLDDTRKAAQRAIPPPAALGINLPVSMDPGAAIPVLSLTPGYATSITVMDAAGYPWPIERIYVGDKTQFDVYHDVGGTAAHTAIVTSVLPHGHSNIVLNLKGAELPVVASIRTNNEVSNYRVNLLIGRVGPNAPPPEFDAAPALNDKLLRDVLDGITPTGATNVSVSGGPATAVLANGRFVLRTSLKVRSPGFLATMRSGGIAVYELPVTSEIAAVNDAGQEVRLVVADDALLEAVYGADGLRGFRSPYAMPSASSSR